MTGRAAGLKAGDAVLPVQPDLTVFLESLEANTRIVSQRQAQSAVDSCSVCSLSLSVHAQRRQHRGPSYGRPGVLCFHAILRRMTSSGLRLIRSFDPWKSCSRGTIHFDCGAPHSPRPALVVSICWSGLLRSMGTLLVAGRQASWRFLETMRTRHDERQRGGYWGLSSAVSHRGLHRVPTSLSRQLGCS